VKVRHDWLLLIGALAVIGALYNHYLGHSVLLFELILLAVGSAFGLISAKLRIGRVDVAKDEGLITRFLSRWLEERTIGVLIPLSGFVLLTAWSVWKVLFTGETNLRMEDFVVTLFALSLILYQSAPLKLHEQRDFVILYLMFLTITFAGIWKLYSLITGESYARITAYSEYYFITIPVVSVVNLFGVDAHAVLNLGGIGLSNIIEYQYEGRLVRLGIGTGCSGLYSAGLFFSAFLAFVLVRYETVNARILAGLGIGLLVTWFSNILRMVVTIVVGSEFGAPALATFHMYFGIIVFICFVLIFWYFIMRWLDSHMADRLRVIAERASAASQDATAESTSEPSSNGPRHDEGDSSGQ
jgi:exosortase/archaeosortase family protein